MKKDSVGVIGMKLDKGKDLVVAFPVSPDITITPEMVIEKVDAILSKVQQTDK